MNLFGTNFFKHGSYLVINYLLGYLLFPIFEIQDEPPCCVRLMHYLLPSYISRVYMCFSFYVAYSLHLFCSSSGLLVFAHLGGINLIAY